MVHFAEITQPPRPPPLPPVGTAKACAKFTWGIVGLCLDIEMGVGMDVDGVVNIFVVFD